MNVDDQNVEIEVITSRRALIDVITGLADHREVLTVLGGDAVIAVTLGLPTAPPGDTSRDGDMGVIPQLLADDPQLTARMQELGYEAARPNCGGTQNGDGQYRG